MLSKHVQQWKGKGRGGEMGREEERRGGKEGKEGKGREREREGIEGKSLSTEI